jgi:hypothetical protein
MVVGRGRIIGRILELLTTLNIQISSTHGVLTSLWLVVKVEGEAAFIIGLPFKKAAEGEFWVDMVSTLVTDE